MELYLARGQAGCVLVSREQRLAHRLEFWELSCWSSLEDAEHSLSTRAN